MIGLVKVPDVAKITAITYCDRDDLSDWLDEIPLSEHSKAIFLHDNARAHA